MTPVKTNRFCARDLIPTRAVVAIMIFMACFTSYTLRANMSLNIIAMVENTGKNNEPHVAECKRTEDADGEHDNVTSDKLVSMPNYGVRYDWDQPTQGLILGSYYWGYIITSIPGGFLAERFGPVKTVGITTILSAALTLLIPLAASWHYGFVIAARFLIGLFGGVNYPSLHCLISRWAPPLEKGKFTGALLGGALGTVLSWPVLGAILQNLDWSWSFFVPGLFVLAWCVLWFVLVTDRPDGHPRITPDEKEYIARCLGATVDKKKLVPPYLKMFLSVPFWAYVVLHFGNLWGLYFLLNVGPKFMSEILGFNIEHSGVLAALPYLARLIFGFVFGAVGDFIRRKEYLSVTGIRKSFVSFSHVIPGLLLVALSLSGCDSTLAVVFLTLSLGMNGASTLTNLQNSQDLAPNFAGTIYGIVNCIGGTTGFITPLLVGFITKEKNGLEEWRVIFWIGAAVYIVSGIVFCVFGSGDIQPWNYVIARKEETEKTGAENPAFEPGVGLDECKEYNTKV